LFSNRRLESIDLMGRRVEIAHGELGWWLAAEFTVTNRTRELLGSTGGRSALDPKAVVD